MADNCNLTTPEGVAKHMQEAQTELEWNSKADQVKAANGGYPAFWYETIIIGGILHRTRAKWKW